MFPITELMEVMVGRRLPARNLRRETKILCIRIRRCLCGTDPHLKLKYNPFLYQCSDEIDKEKVA